jgi:hypothetical protein
MSWCFWRQPGKGARVLKILSLLMQGFSATAQGLSLDTWLAGLPDADQQLLRSWSRYVAGAIPRLISGEHESSAMPQLLPGPAPSIFDEALAEIAGDMEQKA